VVGTDSATAIEDAGERLAAHTQRGGGFRDREPEGLQAQLSKDLARVWRVVHLHEATSVIIFIVDPLGVLRLDSRLAASGEEALPAGEEPRITPPRPHGSS
jgi:hypothetical protein